VLTTPFSGQNVGILMENFEQPPQKRYAHSASVIGD